MKKNNVMKKAVLSLLLILVATVGCRAQISLVQTPGTFASASAATSVSQAFSSANVAGDLIVVMVATPLAVAPTSVTDTNGCTYLQAGANDINQATIFYCTSATAGANTVTVNTGSSTTILLSIAEYKGHLVAHPIGNGNANNSSMVQPFGTIATPVTGSLVINLWTTNGMPNPWTTFSGCTPRTPIASAIAVWTDAIVSSTGLNNCSAFQGTTGGLPDWIGKTVTFLPLTYVAGTLPAYLRQTEGGIGNPGFKTPTSTSPATDTFAGGNQPRNKIIVAIMQPGSIPNNITGVTDTNGDTFSPLPGGAAIADETSFSFYSFYIATANGSNTNNTVSVTFSSGQVVMAAAEFSGTDGLVDTTATGHASYTITTAAANELLITLNGHGSGGKLWAGLSGTDLFFTISNSASVLEWNYFLSAAGSNTITSNISPQFAGSLTLALQGLNPGCSIGGHASLGGKASC